MSNYKKIAWIFPGQGAQYPGMGKGFYENFSIAREVFEQANDVLKRDLSSIVLNGPEETLTETKNSQVGIFVTSIALLRVIQSEFPDYMIDYTAGLSLGEYTALTAANKLSFEPCLSLVQYRGEFMNDACRNTQGAMAVVLGLSGEEVEAIVRDVNLPNDLWAANFNCPGQVVLSGTAKGVEVGAKVALEKGAKRVLPLQVHGAFHSGLMKEAEKRLTPFVQDAPITTGDAELVMNVTGTTVSDISSIKQNLVSQVTHPVRWEQSIRHLMEQGIELFIEVGCGKTLSGFNKRIKVPVPTISIEHPEDLEKL